MNPEQLVAVVTSLVTLVTAIGYLVRQIGELRKDLNGRLSQLVDAVTRVASMEGERRGAQRVRDEHLERLRVFGSAQLPRTVEDQPERRAE